MKSFIAEKTAILRTKLTGGSWKACPFLPIFKCPHDHHMQHLFFFIRYQ